MSVNINPITICRGRMNPCDNPRYLLPKCRPKLPSSGCTSPLPLLQAPSKSQQRIPDIIFCSCGSAFLLLTAALSVSACVCEGPSTRIFKLPLQLTTEVNDNTHMPPDDEHADPAAQPLESAPASAAQEQLGQEHTEQAAADTYRRCGRGRCSCCRTDSCCSSSVDGCFAAG